jgi:hypothetical protein
MVMQDQAQRLSQPLKWTRGGRLAVALASACLAACVLAAGVYGVVHGFGSRSQPGCIDVTVPSTLGAANLHACGSRAKAMCASPNRLTGRDALQTPCRRAGYPLGS